ncbi:MAG: sigma 54-interacting transcriptional regulator [Acidobacteriaceae bacterium]|nr:sigma 54-interacting transcriptional regulator [Acidobacteriaceae bacterium]MBV9295627.1 sigma 54-interacting transcriptional regulator [Acidobacteriaceae bacterium]MBV9766666.1 sigma 54-interacting transcriptional regulator [Acidobacteriaceae bacterium]
MSAELIVVNGPLAGTRYALPKGEIFIGRAPNSNVVLNEPEVGWRHCQIRQQGDRFLIADLRSSLGTYVNGMRSAERWLEDRDQIGIGKSILMFRSAEAGADSSAAPPAEEVKPVLLAACSLVFLFRALAATLGNGQSRLLQNQILSLVSDLIPVEEGVLLLGGSCSELLSRYRERASQFKSEFGPALSRVCEEGAFEDPESGMAGVPLYLSGVLGGALIVQTRDRAGRLTAHLETLTAVASLASIGFEANQEIETLKAENALLQEQIAINTGIVGNSPIIRRLLELVDRVAPRDTTVLITGESGTGKELIARALHQKSARRERPFIAVNCAALSETLFESELFGHEKGAFTGAISLKKGRFELAQGGTIFLDEVGELAPGLQAKLLRVLQQREFERVGGTHAHSLDIRVIAATNRDLFEDVREGRFRDDLYHRLNVVTLDSPPLRDRKEDIPLLAQYFLQRSAERCKRQVQGLSPEAEEMIMQYSWPGNVRELENAMERAVVLGVSEWVLPEDLPETLLEAAPRDTAAKYHHSVGQAKREAILDAYVQGNGDYKQAARVLGLHPNYLLRLVRNLGLRDEINRRPGNAAAG